MHKSFSVTCLFVLMIGAFIGCKATDKEEATKSSLQTNAANVEPKPEGKPIQYRAVCTEKEAHGGNEQMLTKWLDSRNKAEDYGREHGDFKYKGHRWIIEERVKPERVKP